MKMRETIVQKGDFTNKDLQTYNWKITIPRLLVQIQKDSQPSSVNSTTTHDIV